LIDPSRKAPFNKARGVSSCLLSALQAINVTEQAEVQKQADDARQRRRR
jgi:hypothetical protein